MRWDKDEKKKYSLSDIVGKAGIEQSMDNVLQGTKGERTVYVDNLGRVTDTVSRKDPEAGNDVYLTIHKNLQESTYNFWKRRLPELFYPNCRMFWNTIHPA